MELRPMGDTGILVSPLAIGTVQFGIDYGIGTADGGGRPSDAEAVGVLRLAAERGVNFFDTAPAYGVAERLLGEALGGRGECLFATKVSAVVDDRGEPLRGEELRRDVAASLKSSLALLRRDALDLVQIHSATLDVVTRSELPAALVDAKEAGVVRTIGASVYTEAEALAVISAGCFDVVQIPLNLLDRRPLDSVIPAALSAGVGVVARSALLKGVLSPRVHSLPPSLSRLADGAEAMRAALGVSWEDLPAVALRFCLFTEGVSSVIVGVSSLTELSVALDALKAGSLPEEVVGASAEIAFSDEDLLNPSNWGIA